MGKIVKFCSNCDEGFPEKIGYPDFGSFKWIQKGRKTIDIVFTEDDLVPAFESLAREHAPDRQAIVLPSSGE